MPILGQYLYLNLPLGFNWYATEYQKSVGIYYSIKGKNGVYRFSFNEKTEVENVNQSSLKWLKQKNHTAFNRLMSSNSEARVFDSQEYILHTFLRNRTKNLFIGDQILQAIPTVLNQLATTTDFSMKI